MCILVLLKGYLDAYLLESKHVRFICCTMKITQTKSFSVVLCVGTDSITVQKAITILLQLLFWSYNHISLTCIYCVTFHMHGGFSVVSMDICFGVQYMDIGVM